MAYSIQRITTIDSNVLRRLFNHCEAKATDNFSDLDGKIVNQLTNEIGYDAEATVSPKGDKIVFTSTRTGDLELFTMNIERSLLILNLTKLEL